jgi:hypothetical protein
MNEVTRKIAVSVWGKCATEQGGEPKWKPLQLLIDAGIQIVPLDSQDATHYVAFEHFPAPLETISGRIAIENRTLVTFEPRTVNPLMYSAKARAAYGKVYVPSAQHQLSDQEVVYGGGGLSDAGEVKHNLIEYHSRERDFSTLVMVNENKFSLVPESLYSLRARVIKKFIRAGFEFNLGGRNWNRPLLWWIRSQAYAALQCYASGQKMDFRLLRIPFLLGKRRLKYAGSVDSSVEFQSRFGFSAVIENEATYVTEKLFNAIQAGTVPLYCGPELQSMGIPETVAIQVRPSPEDFVSAYLRTSSDQARKIIDAGHDWIQQETTQETWGHSASFSRIAKLLIQDLL